MNFVFEVVPEPSPLLLSFPIIKRSPMRTSLITIHVKEKIDFRFAWMQ